MNEDELTHTLIIHAQGEDWTVAHPESCPTETFSTDFEGKHEPCTYHVCRTQAVLDGNGIDDIDNWRELPPGEYEIKSYYEYIPGELGGSWGSESEIGIFLVKDVQ